MIFLRLLERLIPQGVFYDNMGPKEQGTYITLTPANVEFCDDHVWISNDDWLFFGIQMSYEQTREVINSQFDENGRIDLNVGHIEHRLNENLYRLYDDRKDNWIRVSRENLLSVFQSQEDKYGSSNREIIDLEEGVWVTESDYH